MASVHREHPLLTDRRLIDSIKRVPLRDVWLHEAINFTTWLQDNLDSLSTILDVPLVSAEREQSVGSFNVDLVAEDASGNTVIIENQLEKSDHDHLGKLLTYLVSVDARAAIWIVADPRPEHVSVINWLNESSPSDFYLVKLEAICIDDSLPAPLFTRIVESGGYRDEQSWPVIHAEMIDAMIKLENVLRPFIKQIS